MNELARLIKIEDRTKEIIEELGLKCMPVEFDVVPPEKMLEILAYRGPSNVSSWKFGRDYERLKTIFNNLDPSLPYEVVINSDTPRAYLMNSNTFAVQALVLTHVYGHVAVFTENKWFQKSRRDLIPIMNEANTRFNQYEKVYGIDHIERIVDAGHSIQFHSNPFEEETEDERKKRFFENTKQMNKPDTSEFNDLVVSDRRKVVMDADTFNHKLWRHINTITPIEPVEDLLRYIIDNARNLEDWEKDILEVLRIEGQYFWPIMKTKYINEGFATIVHQKIMNKLFEENLLTSDEHGQYNYSNSLVKASHRFTMNPYLIGSEIFQDIQERWDKGRHGREWDDCVNVKEKEDWDTKEMKGWEKIKDVMRTYTDWFFMQDFLTHDLIDKLDLYIYIKSETPFSTDYVRTDHSLEDIRKLIINSFTHSGIPKIEVINGNFNDNGSLFLEHRYAGQPLNTDYAVRTLKHIHDLWKRPVNLKTVINDKETIIVVDAAKPNSDPKTIIPGPGTAVGSSPSPTNKPTSKP
jgi:stage V sporulation protein R